MKTNFFSPGILTPNRGKRTRSIFAGVLLVATALLFACSTIATFDQVAYDKATGAKAEALALMNKATESYSAHVKEIEAVSLTIDKAYEYDRGRMLNAITVQQWQILRDPDRNLFGGFLRRWREKGSLRPDYIAEKKPDIAEAFDQITGLEIGKRKAN
jgi:hypothetical protein